MVVRTFSTMALILLLSACTTVPKWGRDGTSSSSVALSSASSAEQTMVHVISPLPGSTIASPLMVTGEARGGWYFEASFPVRLLDGNGAEIAFGTAQAQGDWMTADFVPFVATLSFPLPATTTGSLVLEKDNPSGLPENDDSITIPVNF